MFEMQFGGKFGRRVSERCQMEVKYTFGKNMLFVERRKLTSCIDFDALVISLYQDLQLDEPTFR